MSGTTKLLNPFQIKHFNKSILKQLSTPDLLEKLNFVKKTQSGLFQYLPLSVRTINKLSNLIHTKLQNELGAVHLELGMLSPKKLWDKTDRWQKQGNELFKLKDGKGNDFCLIATCEEDITDLMGNYINSYKDMPFIVYQLNKKYRDEKRPRGGLLRGREFVMMDAYSFAATERDSMDMFTRTNKAYDSIFQTLKVPYVKAWADNGDMGGDLSREFHFVDKTGEDTLFECSDCHNTTTQEKTESLPQKEGQEFGNVDVKYGLSKDHNTLICYYFPEGRQLNWNLAVKAMDRDIDSNLKLLSNDKILDIFQKENEDIMFANIIRVMDCRINSRSNFPDFPFRNYLKNNFGQIDGVSIVDAVDREKCTECEGGVLNASKSIEVGHTFVLGTKYSKPMNLKFMDKDNKLDDNYVQMGCYGIGVTRIIGSLAEMLRDPRGLNWPVAIAPYLVSICGTEDNGVLTSQIKEKLNQSSILKDNIYQSFEHNMSLGARINVSHALGIPIAVIVGPKSWPNVEIEVRRKPTTVEKTQWKEIHKQKDQEYGWKVIEPSNPQHLEKHIVSQEHAQKVIELLLHDL
ncbi:hypothetical protein MOUN0_I02762 [Monosporozyma unispora]|nr:hypothetical protein C6P44_001327 [Kazachstania unispora]